MGLAEDADAAAAALQTAPGERSSQQIAKLVEWGRGTESYEQENILRSRVRAGAANALERVKLGAGGVLFEQGDASSTGLFAIDTGEICIIENGVEMRTMGPGQVLGERAMHDTGARRTASVVARSETIMAKLSTRAYMQLNESKARGGTGASKLVRELSMDVGLVLPSRGGQQQMMETLDEADEGEESGSSTLRSQPWTSPTVSASAIATAT